MSMDRISVVSTKTLSAESIQKLSDAGVDCSAHDFVRIALRKQFDPVQHETVLVTSQNALHGSLLQLREFLARQPELGVQLGPVLASSSLV